MSKMLHRDLLSAEVCHVMASNPLGPSRVPPEFSFGKDVFGKMLY